MASKPDTIFDWLGERVVVRQAAEADLEGFTDTEGNR